MEQEERITDKDRLLFGGGFVIGVAFTLLVSGVVAATIAGRSGWTPLASDVLVTIAAGVLFAGVVGVTLYFLAFPSNRIEIPTLSPATGARGTDGESTLDESDES